MKCRQLSLQLIDTGHKAGFSRDEGSAHGETVGARRYQHLRFQTVSLQKVIFLK